jgi:hypothetical protein
MRISKLMQTTFIVLILMTFSIGTGLAFAQESEYTVEIIDYGILTSEEMGTFKDKRNITESVRAQNPKIISQTTEVEGKLGIIFGILYKIIGPSKQREVPGEAIWIFPKAMTNPQTGKSAKRAFRKETFEPGAIYHNSYSFDDDWEIIPGVWTIEIWVDDQKLTEKSFTVIVPQ